MRLAEWRKQEGHTQQQLADLLDTAQSWIALIERSHDPKVPAPDLMLRIFALTRGAVTPNDFYDLPAIGHPQLPGMERANDAPLLADASLGDQ
jgi:transcriptional regulator with XRE-family HTH domain